MRCHDLCHRIVDNRRISTKHENLDHLRAGLERSSTTISLQFNAIRKVLGSRMDLGDDTARYALKRSIREVELDIEPRLYNIATRQDNGPPGFKDMLVRVERIAERVKDTIEDLGERLVLSPEPQVPKPPTQKPAAPKPTSPTTPKLKKTDEAIVSLKELEKLLGHMKNSWEERNVAGSVLYVNCFDDKKRQWERPNGFIKSLPTKPAPASGWEQPSRPR
jgi:hypothetical protein